MEQIDYYLILRKLFSQATGGLRFPIKLKLLPCFLIQLLLYTAPVSGTVAFYIVLPDLKPISWQILAYFGASVLFNALVQIIAHSAAHSRVAQIHTEAVIKETKAVSDRNDEYNLDTAFTWKGYFGSAAWVYILQPRLKRGRELAPRVFASAIIGTAATVYMLSSQMEARTSLAAGTSSYRALLAISWFAVCNALWSLTSRAPFDWNTYYTHDLWSLDDYTRVLHVAVVLGVSFILLVFPIFSNTAGLTLQIVLCLLPAIWCTGILPTFRIGVEWLSEQVLVHVNGGSPGPSVKLTLGYLIYSWLAVVVAFLLYEYIGYKPAVIVGAVLGFTPTSRQIITVFNPDSSPRSVVFFLFVLLAATLLCAIEGPAIVENGTSSMTLGTSIALWIAFGLSVCTNQLSRKYLVCYIKNASYAATSGSAIFKFLCVLMYCVQPMASFLWYTVQLLTVLALNESVSLPFVRWILYERVFRYIWQNPTSSTFDCAVVAALTKAHANVQVAGISWDQLDVGVQLFVVYLIKYVCVAALSQTFSILYITAACFKQRSGFSLVLLVLSLLLLPVSLAMGVVSAAIGAPLLQISRYPVFLIGFPRPRRQGKSFSGNYAFGDNCHFYSNLAARLKLILASSPVTLYLEESDVLLIHLRGLTFMVRVVDRGFDYVSLVFSGIEPFPNRMSSCGKEIEFLESVRYRYLKCFSALEPLVDIPLDYLYSTTVKYYRHVFETAHFRNTIFSFFEKALLFQLYKNVDPEYFTNTLESGDSRLSRLVILSDDELCETGDVVFLDALRTRSKITPFERIVLSVAVQIKQVYQRSLSSLQVSDIWRAYTGRNFAALDTYFVDTQCDELKYFAVKAWRTAVYLALDCNFTPASYALVPKLYEFSMHWYFADSNHELLKRLDPKASNNVRNGFALVASDDGSFDVLDGLVVTQKLQIVYVDKFNKNTLATVWAGDIFKRQVLGQQPNHIPNSITFPNVVSLANASPYGSPVWQSKETVKLNIDPFSVLFSTADDKNVAKLLRVVGFSSLEYDEKAIDELNENVTM